jgi:hypothetical protein
VPALLRYGFLAKPPGNPTAQLAFSGTKLLARPPWPGTTAEYLGLTKKI